MPASPHGRPDWISIASPPSLVALGLVLWTQSAGSCGNSPVEGSAVKSRCGRAAVTGMVEAVIGSTDCRTADSHWRLGAGKAGPTECPKPEDLPADCASPLATRARLRPTSDTSGDFMRLITALLRSIDLGFWTAALTLASALTLQPPYAEAQGYASAVISYSGGTSPASGYTNPTSALGEPTRFTGGIVYPSVVTPFNPAFMPSEILSIGAGGHLMLGFDEVIRDDPDHPFGIDLIIFGNSMFTDSQYPGGVAAALAFDGGVIELSADGTTWVTVPAQAADGGWPTLAFEDTSPYALTGGLNPTDFRAPVNPALHWSDFYGAPYESLISAYNGSGGGVGIDIGAHGLAEVTAVRISAAPDAWAHIEVDAVAIVASAAPATDLDHDGVVSGADLALLLSAWGASGVAADIDGDGSVNGGDLSLLLADWSP